MPSSQFYRLLDSLLGKKVTMAIRENGYFCEATHEGLVYIVGKLSFLVAEEGVEPSRRVNYARF